MKLNIFEVDCPTLTVERMNATSEPFHYIIVTKRGIELEELLHTVLISRITFIRIFSDVITFGVYMKEGYELIIEQPKIIKKSILSNAPKGSR